jgi:hypothetical protein
MNLQRSLTKVLVAAVMAATPALAFAQDYYEDDIYYNPTKKTEKQQQRQQVVSKASTTNQRYTAPIYYAGTQNDYAAADTYALPTGRTDISVDDYNRNGQFLVADSVATDSLNTNDSFAYTRRIERFYNQDVVASSDDETLKDYYYSEDPVTQLNVYVIDPTWGWYGSPWAWRYYTPWYYNCYSPYSWGWGFGWDPFFSWSFGWGGGFWYDGWFGGIGWGFGHGHGWNCHVPGFGHDHGGFAMRPSSPGSSQPHRSGSMGASASRGGTSFANGMSRPGNMGRGRYNSLSSSSSSNRNSAPSNNVGSSSRGRNKVSSSNNNSNSSTRSYNSNSNNSYNSNNSFRSSGSSRTHSSGGFSGGGFGGGGSRGGGSTGGGGGRGRR